MSEPVFNKDGSADLTIDGKTIRFVKEEDLRNVKSGSEVKATEWAAEKATLTTQLSDANRLREETHQSLLKEQAAKEQLVQKYGDYDSWKTKATDLEKQVTTFTSTIKGYETELATRIQSNLLSFGATEDALKGKDLNQLRSLEEAARILGAKVGKPARYDGGSGGTGGNVETPQARAARIIAEAEAKRGRPVQVSSAAVPGK